MPINLSVQVHRTMDEQTQASLNRFLAMTPMGQDSHRVLATMDARQLFRAAIYSKKLYAVVADYLDHLSSYGDDEEPDSISEDGNESGYAVETDHEEVEPAPSAADATEGSNAIDRLPLELSLQVLRALPLTDKHRYLRVSTAAALAASASLRSAAAEILTKFDLLFDEVRLMQTASSAIISGSTVAALAGSPTPFNPNDLDIYAGRGEGWHVVKYLENGNKYRAVKEETSYDFASGIGKVWTLRHRRTDKKINVIESLSSNPLHSVLHFHFTPVFGAWSANEFWHGYADLTASGYAMTTLTHLPLKDDLQNHKHIWKVLQKYKRRGFSFALDECLAPHVCGEHKDCPATLRTSDDAGCLTMAFPVWDFQRDAVLPKISCWTLDGTGCTAGIMGRAGPRTAVSAKEPVVTYWKTLVQYYIGSNAAPKDFLTMLDLI